MRTWALTSGSFQLNYICWKGFCELYLKIKNEGKLSCRWSSEKKPTGKQSTREAKAGLPVRGQPGLHYIKKQAIITNTVSQTPARLPLGFTKVWPWKSLSLHEWWEFCCNSHSKILPTNLQPQHRCGVETKPTVRLLSACALTTQGLLELQLLAFGSDCLAPIPMQWAFRNQLTRLWAVIPVLQRATQKWESETSLGWSLCLNKWRNKMELPCGCFALHPCWINASLISTIPLCISNCFEK